MKEGAILKRDLVTCPAIVFSLKEIWTKLLFFNWNLTTQPSNSSLKLHSTVHLGTTWVTETLSVGLKSYLALRTVMKISTVPSSFMASGSAFCKNGTAIYSSHCPLGFCNYSTDSNGGQMLPIGFSNLTDYVCDDRRKGVLCAQCKEGHSTFYHSYMFRCGDNSKCSYGVVFYFLSELLPLTLMFFAIIVFDIRFTAGAINGFIFYSQVLDSISIDANGAIPFPDSLENLTHVHRFIYRTLNFDFFSLEKLSFCIWENATSLDVLAMKYVTIVYAFILVILLVIFMNTGKCKQAFSCWRPRLCQARDYRLHRHLLFTMREGVFPDPESCLSLWRKLYHRRHGCVSKGWLQFFQYRAQEICDTCDYCDLCHVCYPLSPYSLPTRVQSPGSV